MIDQDYDFNSATWAFINLTMAFKRAKHATQQAAHALEYFTAVHTAMVKRVKYLYNYHRRGERMKKGKR